MTADLYCFAPWIGGWELLLVLILILLLFGIRSLPGFINGIRTGLRRMKDSIRRLDVDAFEAGESTGGIYGKAAAEAITPDNQICELYDPAVFSQKQPLPMTKGFAVIFWMVRVWKRIKGIISSAGADANGRDSTCVEG